MDKIVRSICYFTKEPGRDTIEKLEEIRDVLDSQGFEIQTKRICSPNKSFEELKTEIEDDEIFLSVGKKDNLTEELKEDFFNAEDVAFNLDLTNKEIQMRHVDFLFEMIDETSDSTFSFCYAFNNPSSSPYHPPAQYEKEGFSIGLQPTNLSKDCESLEEWLQNMKQVWEEINKLFEDREDFLGIDSSIAPFMKDEGSLVNFVKRLDMSFSESTVTDTYMKITKFIEEENPNPTGLCGLMLPCLEDLELAEEYEEGNFNIERNIYLSLHSGLGIDTYPIGVDEEKTKVLQILKTVQKLSNKHNKPLSIRFVSDGKSKIGEKTEFNSKYMGDVKIRSL